MAYIDEITRFRESSPEANRLLCEEELILEVTEAIAAEMEAQGLRKVDLAERLGRSKGHVTQMLSGGSNLTLRTVADIALALNCTVKIRLDSKCRSSLKVEHISLKREPWAPRFDLSQLTLARQTPESEQRDVACG